jgi:hypothetical protein
MRAIFISYRRDDSEGQAGRLYDDLSRRFGDSSVFMDVAAIEPGLDFRKVIDHNVASCGVLLAVIGPGWLDAKDETGQRRLDNPTDFVRLETASALKRDIPVVPVLVHGARMPKAEQLPADLGELAYRNGLELTHARWDSDVEVLVKALQRHVKDEAAEAAQGSSKASAAPRSGPVASVAQAPPTKGHGTLAAVAVVAAAVVGFGLYLGLHRSPQPDAGKSTVIATTPAQPQPQSQPQQVAVSPAPKPPEPATQPQTSESEPAATNSPRRIVRKSEPTPPPALATKNASAQTRDPASPAPAVVASAVPASPPPASDTRNAQTPSTDSAKTAPSTPAPVTQSAPQTVSPSNISPTPMPAPNAAGISNPNAQRFVVGHYGATVQDYCVGLMIVDDGYLRYRAVKGTHQIHSFDFPYNRIKEIKKNNLVFSMNLAFHVRMDDGELFNFSELDPNTFRFLSPDALLNAVHTAAGR